jgi:hypothetical protein
MTGRFDLDYFQGVAFRQRREGCLLIVEGGFGIIRTLDVGP